MTSVVVSCTKGDNINKLRDTLFDVASQVRENLGEGSALVKIACSPFTNQPSPSLLIEFTSARFQLFHEVLVTSHLPLCPLPWFPLFPSVYSGVYSHGLLLFFCLFVCLLCPSCGSRDRGWAYPGVSAADGSAGACLLPAAGGHHQEHRHEDEGAGRPSCAQLQGAQVGPCCHAPSLLHHGGRV